MRKKWFSVPAIVGIILVTPVIPQEIAIGRLKYSGGGDWYSNPSSLPNLMSFCAKNTGALMARKEPVVSLQDNSFKKVPILYFTGHGNFTLNKKERENLRFFLKNGGFLFADDNFGMDKHIRRELNQLFPGVALKAIPRNHPIFFRPFPFPQGVPKIHEHAGGLPQAFGLFLNDKLVAFYAANTDLGDGWEDPDVHNDPENKRQQALKMGCNVLFYALTSGLV